MQGSVGSIPYYLKSTILKFSDTTEANIQSRVEKPLKNIIYTKIYFGYAIEPASNYYQSMKYVIKIISVSHLLVIEKLQLSL